MKVSAIIVTRGNVGLGEIIASLDADEIVIRRGHGGVLERWEAAAAARHEVVYVQDDDAVVDFAAVMAAYERGVVTCNMPEERRPFYQDGIALVGWGAVFHRSMVARAFDRYRQKFPDDDLLRREADRVFTGLNPCKLIDVPLPRHLPAAYGWGRMGAHPTHKASMTAIRERIYEVRGYRKPSTMTMSVSALRKLSK